MFVGHFGVAFAGKRWAPKTSLGSLVLAATLADLLWIIFNALGLEHVRITPGITRLNALDLYDYPWSHSLATNILWGALLGGGYLLWKHYRPGAIVLFVAVVSHWVLDWASHRPDMPLAPGIHQYVGLGLYNSALGLLLVEGGLWVAGIVLYLRATRSRGLLGNIVLWAFIVLFTAFWLLSFNGQPPPSIHVMVVVDLFLFPLVFAWLYWADSLRGPTDLAAVDRRP